MAKLPLPPLGNWALPLFVGVVCVVVAALGAEGQLWLRFERDAVAQGEIWRLVSAHLVHLGWSHLVLNLAGLALIWLLVGRAFSPGGWGVVFLLAALGTSAGLWWFSPELRWYVGLSGVLHGLLVAGALASWGQYRDAPFLLGAVAVKVAWEQWAGPMPGSELAAGGPVVVAAHLYGAVSGTAAFGLMALRRRREERPGETAEEKAPNPKGDEANY